MATVAKALWQAWMELNAIRARDGAPQHIDWWQGRPMQTSSVDPAYFSKVVDDCAAAYREITGEDIKPWLPKGVMLRTLDQIIASQRSPAELERLLRDRLSPERYAELCRDALAWLAIPAPPDAPGEEAAARRDRT